jgi:hypothetical protein
MPPAEPRHDNFVPADQSLALREQHPLDAADEPALQRFRVGQVLTAHDFLRERAFAPASLRHFVAADVDVTPWKKCGHFGEHVVNECERFLARTEYIHFNAPSGPHLEWTRRAGERGVGSQRRFRVARHFDLGENGHVSPRRIRDHVANLLLRIEAAMRHAIAHVRIEVLRDHRLLATAANFGQTRIVVDLDAPTLIVREVPVERVQLVPRQQVDVALHELDGHEMPGDIEVHPAILEARRIVDLDAAHWRARLDQLPQRLQSVEESRRVCRGDCRAS